MVFRKGKHLVLPAAIAYTGVYLWNLSYRYHDLFYYTESNQDHNLNMYIGSRYASVLLLLVGGIWLVYGVFGRVLTSYDTRHDC